MPGGVLTSHPAESLTAVRHTVQTLTHVKATHTALHLIASG